MLNLAEIEKLYPENLRVFRRFILREYLQHKLLQIIFESNYAKHFAFLGGTCLRIVHGNSRFSEDLDFDNFGITEQDFEGLSLHIQKVLGLEGYEIEMKSVYKGAYHCYIRFPKILHQEGLSGHEGEKILIQLDTESQHFDFQADSYFLNRFDIFTPINVTPPNLLLSQKLYAILNRVRNKGRDFFDVVFLLGMDAKPNYDYLTQKLNISNPEGLREKILTHCSSINMPEMAKDVQPFLFNPNDSRKVLFFDKYFEQVKLS
jgi:predicted nucleotidyltransferase component of viral defense system